MLHQYLERIETLPDIEPPEANKKDIFKSDKCASNVSNLAEIITSMNVSDEIILAHVRQISVGKVAKVEDSHPFKEKDFVIAHNGTLKWKDKKNESKYIGIIDSEIFAKELQEEYNINDIAGDFFIASVL